MGSDRIAVGIAIAAFAVEAVASSERPADVVVTNARVYTVDAARTWAEAFAVRDGRFVRVGRSSDPALRALVGPSTRVVDAQGRFVLPAFSDSHVHAVSAGIELGQCNLNDAESADEVKRIVAACARAAPSGWLVGGGWDLPVFPDAGPSKALLDELVPDRPAILSSADGHSAWVNSAALRLAAVTKETKDPPDGRIERDASGEPSGTLRESAIPLVSRHAPEPTDGDHRAGLERALRVMNGFGIVAFIEANADERTLRTYAEADRAGRLSARVRVSLDTEPEAGVAQVEKLVALRRAHRTPRVAPDAAKIFIDGVLEAQTGALIEPYLNRDGSRSSNRGLPRYTRGALFALITALDAAGFQVHMHAIGDLAIRMGLDAVEAAQRSNGSRDARHHAAHIQLFSPPDIPRFRSLGVVANFQPLWAYADSYIRDLTEPFLGRERSRWLYPIRSVLDSGATVAAGSDWSVSSVNPLEAIQVALTRRGPSAGPGEPWIPEERADLARMIAAYTIAGAYLRFEEHERGSIEVGKYADYIMLDRNLFDIPPQQIHLVKVVETVFEGRALPR